MNTPLGNTGPEIQETGSHNQTTSSVFRLGLDRMVPYAPGAGRNTERWNRLAQNIKHRLIVVDDETRMCELLALYFEAKGLQVTTAGTSSEILELIEEGGYDLMILDWKLGDIDDGMDILNLSKATYPKVPVVIFTGNEDCAELLKKAFACRADAVVRKMGPLDALAAEVNAQLGRARDV